MVSKNISEEDYTNYFELLLQVKTILNDFYPDIVDKCKELQDVNIPTTNDDTEMIGASFMMSLNNIRIDIEKSQESIRKIANIINDEYTEFTAQKSTPVKTKKSKNNIEDIESMNCIN